MLFARSDQICRGVSVGGVSVAGLSRESATRVLDDWWRTRKAQTITLTALDSRRTLTLGGIGAEFYPKRAADQAYSIGRTGGIFHRAALILREKSPEKQIKASIDLPRKRLDRAVRVIAHSVNKPHKDATLKVTGGRFTVEPEHVGIKVDEPRAADVLSKALICGAALVPLPIAVDQPEVTTDDVDHIDTLLSSYTTRFNPGKRDRTHNLVLAARSVNGVILKPGQVFSYNNCVGPRLMSRGFRSAPIFVRGNLEPGLGGGICQVSSTIYNAVLLAGLHVVERSHHSRTVPYVTPGRDATVAYGLRDFRFENNAENPIGVIALVKGSLLSVYVYGAAGDKKQVKIVTSKLSYRAAGVKTVVDRTLKAGAKKVVDHGSPGASVTVYRKLLASDGAETTELVSRDRYPSQAKVIAHGPAAGAVSSAASAVAKQPGSEPPPE